MWGQKKIVFCWFITTITRFLLVAYVVITRIRWGYEATYNVWGRHIVWCGINFSRINQPAKIRKNHGWQNVLEIHLKDKQSHHESRQNNMSNVPKCQKIHGTTYINGSPPRLAIDACFHLSTCVNLSWHYQHRNISELVLAWNMKTEDTEVSSTSPTPGFASESLCCLPFFGPPCALVDATMQHASIATLATFSTCCCPHFMVQPGVICIPAGLSSSFWHVPGWKWFRSLRKAV